MDGRWSPAERAHVERMTRVSVVGSPGAIRAGLETILAETGADEVIATAQIFDHAARLRSFEILAEAHGSLAPTDVDKTTPPARSLA